MLDELALRKPGFAEGYDIQLSDGQKWTFPRPRLKFFPARDLDGKIALGGGASYDDEYRQLVTAYFECDKDDLYKVWTFKVQIACHLLLLNYTLSDEALAGLLPVEFDDESNMDMWLTLTPILRGLPPKPLADGLSTPSLLMESQAI